MSPSIRLRSRHALLTGALAMLTLACSMPSGAAVRSELERVQFFTDESPPQSYTGENGQIQGSAIELVVRMLGLAGVATPAAKIKIQPWSRSFIQAAALPYACVAPIARDPNHENLFKWIGPLDSRAEPVAILALKSRQLQPRKADNLQDLAIAVTRDQFAEALLRRQGVPERQIKGVTSPDQSMRMLYAGRVDAWAFNERGARWLLKRNKHPADDIVVITRFEQGSEDFIACNPGTPDEVISALQSALNKLRQRAHGLLSEADRIRHNYDDWR